MNINRIFDLLDDWRNLPGYQLERRADIFFGFHLEKILGKKLDIIIPEFPIQKDSLPHHPKFNVKPLKKPNQSFQIDYLCFSSEPLPKVYFIELKTEMNSRNDKQDWYLKSAQNLKVEGILYGLKEIYKATNQKEKYDNLLDKLEKIEWIERSNKSFKVLKINIQPKTVYIQPINNRIDTSIITFDDIIKKLEETNNPLTERFIKSLELWKLDTNKKK